jgi:hydrogenase maturation protease
MTKTLVLGLGNPLLTDDAVGLHVARELRARLGNRPDVEVDEDYHGGLRLMERMIGYDRGIVVDAIRSGDDPGTVHRLSDDSFPTQHSASAHDASLSTALALGRTLNAHLPKAGNVLFFGIEAADVTTFGECCTPEVEAAIPRAVEAVLRVLDEGGIRDGVS